MKNQELRNSMKDISPIRIVLSLLVALAFGIGLLVATIKYAWAWLLPDILPGMVAQGLLPAELNWLNSLKLGLFLGLMAGVVRALVNGFPRMDRFILPNLPEVANGQED